MNADRLIAIAALSLLAWPAVRSGTTGNSASRSSSTRTALASMRRCVGAPISVKNSSSSAAISPGRPSPMNGSSVTAPASPAHTCDLRAAPDPVIQDTNKAATLTQLSCD
jgi:hypothetical protein